MAEPRMAALWEMTLERTSQAKCPNKIIVARGCVPGKGGKGQAGVWGRGCDFRDGGRRASLQPPEVREGREEHPREGNSVCKGLEAGALHVFPHALGPLPLASAHAPDTHADGREHSGMLCYLSAERPLRLRHVHRHHPHAHLGTLAITHSRTHTALMPQGTLSLRPQCPLVASPGMAAGRQLVTLWSPGHCQDLLCFPSPCFLPQFLRSSQRAFQNRAGQAQTLSREPPQGSPRPSHAQPQLSSLNLPLQRLFPQRGMPFPAFST